MSDIDTDKDLEVTREDAENVVGGKMAKKKTTTTTKSSPGLATPPAALSAAQREAAYGQEAIDRGIDPVSGTMKGEDEC